jgi:ATP-dependent DNA helicase RecG
MERFQNRKMQESTLLEKVFRMAPPTAKALSKLKIKTVGDLIRHFPQRYYDPSAVRPINELAPGESVTIFGKLLRPETKKAFRKRIPMAEATVENESGKIKVVWFNQPYIAKMFGEESLVRIEGRVSQKKSGELYFSNPKIEKVLKIPEVGSTLFRKPESAQGEEDREMHTLYPVYPESRGISSNWIFHSVQKIFRSGILDVLIDPIPEEILKKYHLPSLKSSLVWIHSPRNKSDAEAARKRFAFEEIFFIQIDRMRERKMSLNEPAFLVSKNKKEIDEFTSTFPFPLTHAQQRSIDTIIADLDKGHPMSRLLEGDVGSGKTAVAATLAYATVTTPPPSRQYGNLQVAYMAPTEILAEQHFESFIENFKKNTAHPNRREVPIGLITGSGAKKFPSKVNGETWTNISKPQLLKWVASGEIPILIGTHALIYKKVAFKNLATIIIDEQHRFGVKQRMQLRRKQDIVPHLLSMTATPIPRTLALTLFGDLDLSLLDELPAGRKPVITEIVLPNGRQTVYEKVRKELNAGRQAYILCPRIDEPDSPRWSLGEAGSDKELAVQAKSVKEEAKRLSEKVFKEFNIGVLHGKMLPKEKERIMKEFKQKKIDILVATSVIEVGVNVPNATVIIIEGAERFGLAQLHQLRGRVLRSSYQPYCYVFTESNGANTQKRMKAFVTAKNGFELAEFDLEQRGAGDLLGVKQWGVSDLAMEALKNIKMVEAARAEAEALIEKDSELKNYPVLREKVIAKTERIHME